MRNVIILVWITFSNVGNVNYGPVKIKRLFLAVGSGGYGSRTNLAQVQAKESGQTKPLKRTQESTKCPLMRLYIGSGTDVNRRIMV